MDNIELDKKKLGTYPLASRPSKVSINHFAGKLTGRERVGDLLDKLPGFLAADDLKNIISAIITAFRQQRSILLGMGAHVIKVGLTPLILQLVEKGILNGIALNGAGIIHDFELAYAGHTSEEVAAGITGGDFGMARETGELLNRAILLGDREGLGLGAAVGRMIWEEKLPNREMSLLGQCYRMQIPVTVHVAIGTDIIHMHAAADGAAIGRSSFKDFDKFCGLVAQLEGGVYINLGSAVILPEVFLKAISLARNLGHKVDNLTTVNMDFNRHYRPFENV
ncbi:MAG: hypothetical protein KAI69_07960, partial [Deltaproteobacteria bacterium]|nr:hypothetical protein [Deltaproteobacteria bacterium]